MPHSAYVEQSNNKSKVTLLFLHGTDKVTKKISTIEMNSYLHAGILLYKEGFINMPAKHISIRSKVLQIMPLQHDCKMNLLKGNAY